ncbi:MAG: hypothetical protein HY555_05475 [Euryarchaeota archaeon]|nr:hypothetical protein [Euryarchaeota archaeon]
MRRLPFFLALFVLLLAGQGLLYYRGVYTAPPTAAHDVTGIEVPRASPTPFADSYEVRGGTVLLDMAHENAYTPTELGSLLARITARGYGLEYLEEKEELGKKLRYADALVVIAPMEPFGPEEMALIRQFVEKGGRVVLVADPTREMDMRGISTTLGVVFEDDYLYNLKENDGNFRNIYIRDFRENAITRGLGKVALYTASSVTSDGGIAFTDENTFSSVLEGKRGLSPMALTVDSRVLALGDLTFLIEPYDTVADNPRLISNIADFLTTAERRHRLPDFPYYFQKEVEIITPDASLVKAGIRLRAVMRDADIEARLVDTENRSRDTVLLGLYSDPVQASTYLDLRNVTIMGGKVKVGGIGVMETKETAFIVLVEEQGRTVLVILSGSADGVEKAVEALDSGKVEENLLTDSMGLVAVNAGEKKPPATTAPPKNSTSQK